MPADGSRHPLSVLRVDDCPDTVESSADVLRLYGFEVRTARSGAEALALLDGWHPDVACLDLLMPGLDGYELARRLCVHPGGRPLLVAITGLTTPAARKAAEAAGFAHFLVKPVSPDTLVGLLLDHATRLTGNQLR
jgi:CheY-like chemotaxis protein